MARGKIELSDIIEKYGKNYRDTHSLTKKQKAVLSAILFCRTQRLGYHIDQCASCKYLEISYNSCRDRHCPKCQSIAQRQWVAKRVRQLLPVPYYHVVFTLPAALSHFSLYNKKLTYNLLFDSAAETLKKFGKDPRWLGGKIGFYGILHTWGQTLWHHPHVHFIVAGGAIKADGSWITPRHNGKFLFPVRALSKVFRGIFMRGLKNAIEDKNITIPNAEPKKSIPWKTHDFTRSLVTKDWVVYCKSPFKNAEKVIRYIGRYTHRVALSNSRIISVKDHKVRFKYKDYKQNKASTMELGVDDFLQRFLWHILPERFHRIRYYGFLANGLAEKACQTIRTVLGEKTAMIVTTADDWKVKCPACGTGTMVLALLVTASGYMIYLGQNGLYNDSS